MSTIQGRRYGNSGIARDSEKGWVSVDQSGKAADGTKYLTKEERQSGLQSTYRSHDSGKLSHVKGGFRRAQQDYDHHYRQAMTDGKIDRAEQAELNSKRSDLAKLHYKVNIAQVEKNLFQASFDALKDGKITPKEEASIRNQQATLDRMMHTYKHLLKGE